ncbi:MAG: metalloregulator ArsR/SmtB family transcription factor [Myxococcota bacterium]|nr:metalloregulator ArsR/SmtB family transcription factor [Myxococcota bacterium]
MNPVICNRLSTLSEPTRARILRVLERGELGVGEVAQVMRLPQSTVSRHLKVLLQGGWVQKRSAGTANFFRLLPDSLSPGDKALWELVRVALDEDPALEEDITRLETVLAQRAASSSEFFGRLAGGWDALRRDMFGDGFVLPTLLSLVPGDLVVADLGCGTGGVLVDLAPCVERAVGVDREQAMLDVAASRLEGVGNVELRRGSLESLPLGDEEVDAALCMLVLHHVDSPARVFSEVARSLRPNGRFLLLDMVAHEREEYENTMGHKHLGFTSETIGGWAQAAGLHQRSHRVLPVVEQALGPPLFLAVLERV